SLKGGNPKRLTRSCFTMRREFKCKSDGRLLSRILALCGFENRELLLGLPLTTSSSRTPNRAGKIVARYVAARSKAGEALNEGLTRPSRHGCRLNMGSKGKVVLITGSTDGVGRLVARRLADQGAHILIHGRDRHRGKQVVDQIQEAGRGSAAFLPADFSSLAEVRRLADALGQDCDRLDVLINNAGTGSGGSGGKRETSQDGYELRFAVNYLAGFLLTRLLLSLMLISKPARIVNVSSLGQHPIDFDDVMLTNGYSGGRA